MAVGAMLASLTTTNPGGEPRNEEARSHPAQLARSAADSAPMVVAVRVSSQPLMDISLQPQARLLRRAGSSSSSATRCTTVTCDGRHPLRRCARSRRSRPTSLRTSRTRSRSCTASSTTTSTCCTCCSPSSRMSAPMPPRYTPSFRKPPSLHPVAFPLPCTPLHPLLHSPAPPHPSMHIAPHLYLQTLNAPRAYAHTPSHTLTRPHTPSRTPSHTLTHSHTFTHTHTHS